ncbi:hypothetical protein EB796_012356 [Bugula neritina]|uniref:Uncharacterized protein n=1 Tax=Bugula neritina TaxID=10212 RepID=A0A7J7JUL0_BUGNE|nr:hypothetical protein EB796_012356 [Bugula neritina]
MNEKMTEGDPQQPRRHSSTRLQRIEKLIWDINHTDLLLYLVTPIILVISVIVLTCVSPSQSVAASKNHVECWFPAQFTSSWIEYGKSFCLSEHATLYHLDMSQPINTENLTDLNIAEYFDQIDLRTYFATPETPFMKLIIMALLCFAPIVAWRVLAGILDGSEFISNTSSEPNSMFKGLSLILWVCLTKLGSCVVCVLLIINMLNLQASNNKTATNLSSPPIQGQDPSVLVLCQMKTLSFRPQVYTHNIQCLITQELVAPDDSLYFIAGPLLKSVLIWVYGVTIAISVNAVCALAISLMCFFKSYRLYFIKSKAGKQDMKKYCAVDYGLGVSGVMVASLGARNGGSHQVRDLIQQLCDDITSY